MANNRFLMKLMINLNQ